MPHSNDVRVDRRFWYGYYAGAFGQRGPEFDTDVLSTCLEVGGDDAQAWWQDFSGWYDGVLEHTDGQVDEPARLAISLDDGTSLDIEVHPGDTYVYRHQPNQPAPDTIANFGPHWWLPEWRLGRVRELAGTNPFALLVLAPLVRLQRDELAIARESFAEAWVRTGLVGRPAAFALAEEWLKCASEE